MGLPFSLTEQVLLGLNLGLLALRLGVLAGIRGSYQDPPGHSGLRRWPIPWLSYG